MIFFSALLFALHRFEIAMEESDTVSPIAEALGVREYKKIIKRLSLTPLQRSLLWFLLAAHIFSPKSHQ